MRLMLQQMTTLTEPNHVERELVSSVVMAVWLAFVKAFRARVWSHKSSSFNGVIDGVSGFKFLGMVLPKPSLVLSLFFWMKTTPPRFQISTASFVEAIVSLVFCGNFSSVKTRPFSLVSQDFFRMKACPLSLLLS